MEQHRYRKVEAAPLKLDAEGDVGLSEGGNPPVKFPTQAHPAPDEGTRALTTGTIHTA